MMYQKWAVAGVTLLVILVGVEGVKNSVTDVEAQCDENVVNVTLHFEKEFTGVVHVKGSDCLAAAGAGGRGESTLQVQLLARKCFLRVYKELGTLWYTGNLHVQMSETVLQATDPVVPIKCALGTEMLPLKHHHKRTGRKMGGDEEVSQEDDAVLGKAWLEVRGSAISTLAPNSNSLDVGEHTLLSVFASLSEHLSARPVDCKVEDGRGGVQALTDERGCTMDPTLLPSFKHVAPGHWATAFPAFSFPDSQLVHYKCILMICSGECPEGNENDKNVALLDLTEEKTINISVMNTDDTQQIPEIGNVTAENNTTDIIQQIPEIWNVPAENSTIDDTQQPEIGNVISENNTMANDSNIIPMFNCSEEDNSTRGSRDFNGGESILDLVELYNSVEVTAPNIDFGYLKKEAQIQPQENEAGWVCMSGPKVALVFATLGALFLAAVFATLLLLIRHRRRYLKRYQYGLYT